MMANKRKRKDEWLFRLTFLIFVTVFVSYIFLGGLIILIYFLDDYEVHSKQPVLPPFFSLIFTISICLILVWVFAIYLGKRFLRPIAVLQRAMNEVKNGNFNIRIDNIYEHEAKILIDNFNLMVGELRKSETLKNDFISNVSHEFKTPLSSIQGYATLLQDETLSKEDKDKYTKYIIDSTQRLNVLVSNILKMSKIDNQKIVIEQEVFELDEQIREVVLSLEKEWTNKSIELDIDLEEVSIKTDKTLLSHVWSNIISNAIKFSYDNSKIEIKLKVIDDKIKVTIKDYGIGIEEDKLPYIFNKFYQGDTSHSKEGNGLGLALVKGILDLINGEVEVKSEVNKGTEFIVTLNK